MEQAVVDVARPPGDVTITPKSSRVTFGRMECAAECCPVLPSRLLISSGTPPAAPDSSSWSTLEANGSLPPD